MPVWKPMHQQPRVAAARPLSFLFALSLILPAAILQAAGPVAAADLGTQRLVQQTQQPPQPAAPRAQTPPPGGNPPPPQTPAAANPPSTRPPAPPPKRPEAVILDNKVVSGILGIEVRSAANENMGRIVDVIVDRVGQPRAAIIDFGGFLGVGSRKIAVDWNALHFAQGPERNRVILEFTRDQVKAVPEYQDGKPIVVLGAVPVSGNVAPAPPEK
jgi:hypothetical protein